MNILKKLFILSVLSFSVGSVQAFVIDDFNSGAVGFPGIFALGATGSASGSQTGTMLGGTRSINVQKIEGGGASIITVIAPGVLDINNGSTERSEVTLSWAFSPVDFTDAGLSSGLFLTLPASIDNIMDVIFTLDDGSNSSELSISFPDGTSGDDFFFAFSGFVGSADLTAIINASIMISSPDVGLDTQIDLIETRPEARDEIPEPALTLLLGLGLIAVSATVKRNKALG